MNARPLGFAPRMRSETHGLTVIGGPYCREWSGVIADDWEVRCEPGSGGVYWSPDPRIFIVLEVDKGGAYQIACPGMDWAPVEFGQTISYVPAETQVLGRSVGASRLRHLDLHFSEDLLVQRFQEAVDLSRLQDPCLNIFNPPAIEIARLLAAECTASSALHDLYADGLINALFAMIFDIRSEPVARAGLSGQQLRVVIDFIEGNCFKTISLAELAGLAGLSESHFSRAFKAATGAPPYRWQMQHRVKRAKALLLDPETTIAAVATTAGFADQSHFTRVFKQMVGVTPAVWLKARL